MQFKELQKQKFHTAYHEKLRVEKLNPQKPSREYMKPSEQIWSISQKNSLNQKINHLS